MKPTTLLILALGIVLLGGLFFIVKPQQQPQNAQPATQESITSSPIPASNIKTFELVIKDKKIQVSETMTVNKDDEVIFKITSDTPGEFHVHGYNQTIALEKNVPAELKLTASLTGRFEIEFHDPNGVHTEIAALEVQPE